LTALVINPDQKQIRVKLVGKYRPGQDGAGWQRHFPNGSEGNTKFGNCEFVFDRHERNYDWLVVWDDLPSVSGERHTLWEEELACPRSNTILVTTEPSTIKVYGSKFLRQFGHVLTSQEPWAIGNHPNGIWEQTGYVWFYSHSEPRGNYDTIRNQPIPLKTGEISAVCSIKQQQHTLHKRRYNFVMDLKQRIPEMELFGRGIRYIEDKADALDAYKYHVAIENFYGPHHWTEKLADPFLGGCMPVYYGCPNAEDYFPEESFIRIDLADSQAAAEIIKRAIKDRLYEKNLSAILESRRRVIEEYAPVATISKLINRLSNNPSPKVEEHSRILSRHALRRKSVFNALSYYLEKTIVSLNHKIRH
jgi:hypothetical protein